MVPIRHRLTPRREAADFLAHGIPRLHVLFARAEEPAARMAQDVAAGLTDPRCPRIPSRYFYDARGSELYERITELAAYYPTRSEAAILRAHAGEIARLAPAREIVELGSGSSTKTRLLLEAYPAPLTYVPIDVSSTMLEATATRLVAEYPGLRVLGLCGTFEAAFEALPREGDRLIVFLGGTIGNFGLEAQRDFFTRLAAHMRPGQRLLLGFDRRAHEGKPAEVIQAAYNDPEGVTAAFNLNALAHLNRELGADFDLAAWRHEAPYVEREHQIEMRLIARSDQVVTLARLGLEARFPAGTRLLTEISRKYDPDELALWFEELGFTREALWSDPAHYFGLMLLRR